MKKRKFWLLGTIVMAIVMVLAFFGCSEAEVSSTLTIYSDLSGTKTVVVRVYGDEEPLDGRDYTAGNNTSFMLTQGDELAEKLQEFCKLDGVKFSVVSGKTKYDSTYITMTFDFENIADYNQKAKTIAGKYSEGWIDATLTQSGDQVTVCETASNLPLLYLDMLEQYFTDFDCYPVYEYGPNTQSQIIPNGIQFQGDDMYSFTWWVVPTSAEIVVGTQHAKDTYFVPEEDYEYRADLSGEYTEVTGVPAARPTISSIAVKEGAKTQYNKSEAFAGAMLVVTYSDSSTVEIPVTSGMLSGFDTSAAGTKTVTITYEGKTAQLQITVTEPATTNPPPSGDQNGDQSGDTPAPTEPEEGMPIWGYVLIALGCVLAVGAVTAVIMWRKKK